MTGGGSSDAFALSVTRQAVCQIGLAVGVKHSYASVLDCLTELVEGFIKTVGEEALAKANGGGRTQVTVLDVIDALAQPQHRDGRDRYELDWRSLRAFAFRDVAQPEGPDAFLWYQPFHTRIPPFPVRGAGVIAGRKRPRPPAEDGQEPSQQPPPPPPPQWRRPGYVPPFLPPFPPEHTFRKTRLRAAAKTEDAAAIQRHKIATKQLILRAMQKATAAAAAGPGGDRGATWLTGLEEQGEEEEEDAEAVGKDGVEGVAVVSLPSAEAVMGARPTNGKGHERKQQQQAEAEAEADEDDDDDDLFSSDAQPFNPVASPAEVKRGGRAGGTVGGGQS